ncbi:MAG: GC-type dockerin domain-anchored protein [Phycisphaerales bacterium JB039]
MTARLPAALLVVAAAGAAQAGPIDVSYQAPSLDRWMYPFGTTPGTETIASTFGALGLVGFDDRDAQFIIGFDTEAEIPTGLELAKYRVVSARVILTVARDAEFVYDPTSDALGTYFDSADPGYTPDADDGRPVEMFAVGYRGGFDLTTWEETTFFGDPVIPPAEGGRNAFAAEYDDAGGFKDLSSNVLERFEVFPFAVGQTDTVAPGDPVLLETELAFEIDPCAPGARRYFAEALQYGRLNLAISSLHRIDVGATNSPAFHTRESVFGGDPFFQAAKLEMTVLLDDDADLNGDGSKDFFDFLLFQNLFAAGDPLADFTGDCALDFFDFLAFQNAFAK